MTLGRTKRRAASPTGKPTYGRGSGVPHPIDVYVGSRIRVRRLLLGMNQQALANQLGLTFQQVQKYEGGSNRVSASRLAEMATALGVSVSYFFAEAVADENALSVEERHERDVMRQPETIELIRFYYAIADSDVRRQFLDLVKAVASGR